MMVRSPRGRPDVQVFAEVGVIDRLASTRMERALPDGMSHAQFSVLARLAARGQAETPAGLARAFVVTKGAMTNTLQRLEARGQVAIEADPRDGRSKRVSITPAGLTAHDAALAALRPMMDGLRGRFAEAQFVAALPFLGALRDWLEETR
jgi:DNA-binding MarR family transcriptional regulator